MTTYSNGVLTVIEACDKVRITKGKHSYHADTGGAICLPLPYGDGVYTVEMLRRKHDNVYTLLKRRTVNAVGTDKYLLQPNAFVPYIKDAWEQGEELAHGKAQKTAYKAVVNWAKANILYDYVKAVQVAKKGVIPNPAECWKEKRGICQDMASLVAGMLRAAGIPTRLCIGYADGRLHAWAESNIGGKLYRYEPCNTVVKTYTKDRWY